MLSSYRAVLLVLPTAPVAAQARYVRTKLMLAALDSVSSDTAAFTLLLPGTAGMSVHAKGTDPAARDKLEAQLAELIVKLQLEGVFIGGARNTGLQALPQHFCNL